MRQNCLGLFRLIIRPINGKIFLNLIIQYALVAKNAPLQNISKPKGSQSSVSILGAHWIFLWLKYGMPSWSVQTVSQEEQKPVILNGYQMTKT